MFFGIICASLSCLQADDVAPLCDNLAFPGGRVLSRGTSYPAYGTFLSAIVNHYLAFSFFSPTSTTATSDAYLSGANAWCFSGIDGMVVIALRRPGIPSKFVIHTRGLPFIPGPHPARLIAWGLLDGSSQRHKGQVKSLLSPSHSIDGLEFVMLSNTTVSPYYYPHIIPLNDSHYYTSNLSFGVLAFSIETNYGSSVSCLGSVQVCS